MQASSVRVFSEPLNEMRDDRSPACLLGGDPYPTYAGYQLTNERGEPFAQAGRATKLLQWKMLELASRTAPLLQVVPDREWMRIFESAGEDLASASNMVTAALTSCVAGLPQARVRKAYAALAADLSRMRELLEAQAGRCGLQAFRSGRLQDCSWRFVPRGRNLAVRLPANFPTVNINWLIALAMRRPVVLCASLADPFSAGLLIQYLRAAGMPAGAVSLAFHEAPVFWEGADQVLFSGNALKDPGHNHVRVLHYHHGRSKAVLSGTRLQRGVARRLVMLAIQGCGRLCTNVSAVLTDQDAAGVASALAAEMARFEIRPLDDPDAMVPAFPDRAAARAIAAAIAAAIARGARDITAEISGQPLLREGDEGAFLRPTVLLVDADDQIFGVEFPFPFLCVAHSPASEFVARCRNSLIVSVIGGTPELLEDFVLEPAIDKVFHGEEFDRGYDPIDPHEGYLADFLFHKKAVSSHV
jgi:thienamycin biosynthesis protein ThnO